MAHIFTYGLLFITIISLWIPFHIQKRIPLFALFLALTFFAAIINGYATIISFLYASLLGFSIWHYYKKGKHLLTALAILGLCIPLLMHLPIIGFSNFKVLDSVKITPSAYPYSLYINFDKALIGIFILGFGGISIAGNILTSIKLIALYFGIMCLLFFGLVFFLGYTKFEPKLPSFTAIWMLANLLITCIAEEALFRKFIQDSLQELFSINHGKTFALVCTSILFGLMHFPGGITYIGLSFLAGLFYGHIYQKTKAIESSILLHFLFNLTHFVFFTYPALSQG